MSSQSKTAHGSPESLVARVIHRWGYADERDFLLRVVQPGLVGLIDGTISSLAPIFAAAITSSSHTAFVVGLGVALGRSPMVDAELAAGRLVRPFAKRVVAKASEIFALAWRDSGASQDQRITAFRDFALDEACGCELAAGPCGMPASEKDSRTRANWMAGRAARRAMIVARQQRSEPLAAD